MIKQLVILLVFLTSTFIDCLTLCESECPCSNDDPCKYYCENRKCQPQIRYDERCSGYHIHPRECGYYYCDPDSHNTCQSTKSSGVLCNTSWSCSSDYCDSTLKTCQHKPYPSSPSSSSWKIILYISIPAVALSFICTVISTCAVRRAQKRRLALIQEANRRTLATTAVFAVQNTNSCQESAPPTRSEAATDSIQNNTNNT